MRSISSSGPFRSPYTRAAGGYPAAEGVRA